MTLPTEPPRRLPNGNNAEQTTMANNDIVFKPGYELAALIKSKKPSRSPFRGIGNSCRKRMDPTALPS